MNVVNPIRCKKQLEAVKGYLRGKNKRDYLLFMVGITSALRISDILSLKVNHVWDGKKPAEFIELNEKKTGKYKRFPVTPNLKKQLKSIWLNMMDVQTITCLLAGSAKTSQFPVSTLS